MIEITKGNPTSEEIAALVAVLMLVCGAHQSRPTGSTSGQWRRATRFAEVNPVRRADVPGVGGLALAPRTPQYRTGFNGAQASTSADGRRRSAASGNHTNT
jgi:hypothetical protein